MKRRRPKMEARVREARVGKEEGRERNNFEHFIKR